MHFSLKHNEYTQHYWLNISLSQMLNWEKDRPSNVGSVRGEKDSRPLELIYEEGWWEFMEWKLTDGSHFFFLPTISPPWAPAGIFILHICTKAKSFWEALLKSHAMMTLGFPSIDSHLWVLWVKSFSSSYKTVLPGII